MRGIRVTPPSQSVPNAGAGTGADMTAVDPTVLLEVDETLPAEVSLPTFQVLARLRSDAPDEGAAVQDVEGRLSAVRGLYDEVVVERREDDGSYWVVALFVTVSVDAHTAVVGVHESLQSAGITVDESWVVDS